MLYWLTQQLVAYHSGFHAFSYITLRAIMGMLTALGLGLLLGPVLIAHLAQRQLGQQIRSDGPQSHLSKAGTPTMGGALILLSIASSTLLWADLGNRYIWIALLTTLLFGMVGWLDDYLKIYRRSSNGLSARCNEGPPQRLPPSRKPMPRQRRPTRRKKCRLRSAIPLL